MCRRTPLYADFPAIADLLAEIHRQFLKTAETTLAAPYATEWILDNYYVIQQALRQIKQDLPPKYYAELPKLGDTVALCGYPRVYALALAILWEADHQLDADRIAGFALAYQSVQPLETGELWALPIMLRLALLQIIVLAAGSLSNELSAGALPESFAALQFAAAEGDHAAVELDEAAVAHAIPSLRVIDNLDWTELFERISLVHQALCKDPAGVYPYLDFATRNRYRHVIEMLHRPIDASSELEIAEMAVELAANQLPADLADRDGHLVSVSAPSPDSADRYADLQIDCPRAAHVGYYLIDDGRQLLEARIGYKPPLAERATRWIFDHPTGIYFSLVGLIALAALALASIYLLAAGGSLLALVTIWLLVLVLALTAGVGVTNWLITHTVAPRTLPKLDFQAGVPQDCRTALVVPALIAQESDIDYLAEQMEQHYLRNPDPQLVYVLLTDFSDADHETEPADERLLERAQQAMRSLNDKVVRAPFYLFHRRRFWNPSQRT